MRKGKFFSAAFIFALVLIGSMMFVPAAMGADTAAPDEKNWEFNLAPFYIWGVAIDGDLTLGTRTVPVEIPFSSITENLDTAFIVHFEGIHKSNWGFIFDVNYLDLSNDVTLPGPFNLLADVDFTAKIAEASAFYSIIDGDSAVDLIGGLRYTALESSITVSAGPELADVDQDWLDPIFGVRWRWGFAEKWTLVARGDIGGFGIGSDFSAQGLAVIDWQPFQHVSFLAGYRALYQDYSDDPFRFDATMHGPILGLNFRW